MLSDLERDALAELGNIGIGRASTALGRMLGGLVTLSVPTVEMVPPDAVARLLDRALIPPLVGISETLGGLFSGCALLVFPQAGSLPLVRAALPPDVAAEDAPALEDEVLAELGNVVLNSALAQIANLLGEPVETGLPAVFRGGAAEILRGCSGAVPTVEGVVEGAAVLFHIDLRTSLPRGDGGGDGGNDGGGVGGRVVLLLDAGSAGTLQATLGRYIGRLVA
ncbi:chemotaxis protein CheC [Azospirillum lipoferum]|uniref:Chemotaxis protein CheC n=1 Tax=Azospirillum lipoferum TaxID=193 RepID=A0A5A9GEG1_AZOLI|nr:MULTISPECIES: chemotaxis protein CheC [Azospirillum]KAA0592908.1 chemotaxis protein CheC [Azospirillum lipoferum]MCP1614044.1 chemotaxis protein CheC [Azospirillum lipoferum]MDW5537566.1 chemotaxis protein CheC [Azospirillum sp. NL1]